MALIAILRNAGATIVRTPLLWLFSAVVLLTNDVPSLWQSNSSWLTCLALLLIPIRVLAEAGQIRSVHLHHEGTPTTISQVIRHGTLRMGPLIVVWVATWLLMAILYAVLVIVAKMLLQQVISPAVTIPVAAIANAIAYAFMTFALCAIVISYLPLRSSLLMVFRALQKDAFTILIIVILFGVLRYFISINFQIMGVNSARIAAVMLADLIVIGIQSAVFTFAYLAYAEEPHEES
jgi:hypothetical protein